MGSANENMSHPGKLNKLIFSLKSFHGIEIDWNLPEGEYSDMARPLLKNK